MGTWSSTPRKRGGAQTGVFSRGHGAASGRRPFGAKVGLAHDIGSFL